MSRNIADVKVLVVDDNQINLYVADGVLEGLGIKADCVPNGEACIRKVSKKPYDIIFMDHMMPDMDGIETFRKLRQDPEFKIPVVAMTANIGAEYEALYKNEGFASYLAKPIDGKKIASIINAHVLEGTGVVTESHEKEAEEQVCDARRDKLVDCGFAIIDDLIKDGMAIEEFETLLDIFREESETKKPSCDEYARNKDIANYAIIVHGLKNDAAMISDMDLSAHSKEHEIQSKAGNQEFVDAKWPELEKHWEETLERIDKYFNN